MKYQQAHSKRIDVFHIGINYDQDKKRKMKRQVKMIYMVQIGCVLENNTTML